MNLAELNTEIRNVVRDPTVEASINGWINDVLLQLASDLDFPALRVRTPGTLAVTPSAWLYDLSDVDHVDDFVYQKKVFRVTSATFTQGLSLDDTFETLDDIDPDHDDTGANVERIAIEGDQLGVYPLTTDTLSLWFYRRPATLSADTDTPTWMPEAFHSRVIVSHVVLRAFRLFPDLSAETPEDNVRALSRWQGLANQSLYGDGNHMGLVHTFHQQRKPRVRGARMGSNLSGADWWRP
jgi:hypothetical protein